MKYGKAYGGADPEMIEGDVFRIIVKVPEFGSQENVTPDVTGEVTRQVPDKYPTSDPTRGGCVGDRQKPCDQNRTAKKREASGSRTLC